jgi:tRNA dimethylallyltransferase
MNSNPVTQPAEEWSCIVLAGPTATGKTALAVELAHRLGSEIFSVDSRQVYRGLDLGTGKDLHEYGRFSSPVPYHLIDIEDPAEVYSLFRFQEDCYQALEEFRGRHGRGIVRGEKDGNGDRCRDETPPVLVGGTGLYLEAVLKKYDIAQVPEDTALREELTQRDLEALKAELKARAPDIYERTDLSTKRRVVRALEIALRAPSAEIPRSKLPPWNLKPLIFVTQWERSVLRERIADRLQARLQAGLVEEVRRLHEQGLAWERLDHLGMEYRQIAAYLREEKSYEAMSADLLHEIHLLAKRQDTYFRGLDRRGLKVHFIGSETTASELFQFYQTWKTG